MRFLAFHTIDESTATAPSAETMAEMTALIEEMTAAGVLVATGGLQPSSTGVRIRFKDGERTVTDGPFIETKELVAGFAILEAATLEEAMGWSTRFARLVGDTQLEIRPMFEGSMEDCSELVRNPEGSVVRT
jgi:PhnB protein